MRSPQKDLITTEGLRLKFRIAVSRILETFPQKDLITTEGLRRQVWVAREESLADSPKRPDHHGGIETELAAAVIYPYRQPQKDLIATEGLRLMSGTPVNVRTTPQKDLITTEGLRRKWLPTAPPPLLVPKKT